MSDLEKIEGIEEGVIDLLEAVGVEDLSALAFSDSNELEDELKNANRLLKLVDEIPASEVLGEWIRKAQELTGEVVEVTKLIEETGDLKTEGEDLVEMEIIPTAYALEKGYIKDNGISVDDVLVMEDFLESDDLEDFSKSSGEVKRGRNRVAVREVSAAVLEKKNTRKRERMEIAEEDRKVIEPLKKAVDFDIRKTASPELNLGKTPHARSYIRGVLHPQPIRIKVAAVITLITLILMPLSFVVALMIIFGFPIYLAVIPALFLLVGLIYVMVARPLKCRVCGQPLFAAKLCHRHMKAHHAPLLGYIFPTAIHLLLFHWFRCSYCGTSVRLKQ